MIEKKVIAQESLKGASRGGALAAAGSIISGVAMASVPVKILGLLTVGTATVVSIPVVVAVAAGGAVVGGAAAAYSSYRKQKQIEEEFDRLTKGQAGVNVAQEKADEEPVV